MKPQNPLVRSVPGSYNCGLNIACLGTLTIGEKRKKKTFLNCMEKGINLFGVCH